MPERASTPFGLFRPPEAIRDTEKSRRPRRRGESRPWSSSAAEADTALTHTTRWYRSPFPSGVRQPYSTPPVVLRPPDGGGSAGPFESLPRAPDTRVVRAFHDQTAGFLVPGHGPVVCSGPTPATPQGGGANRRPPPPWRVRRRPTPVPVRGATVDHRPVGGAVPSMANPGRYTHHVVEQRSTRAESLSREHDGPGRARRPGPSSPRSGRGPEEPSGPRPGCDALGRAPHPRRTRRPSCTSEPGSGGAYPCPCGRRGSPHPCRRSRAPPARWR